MAPFAFTKGMEVEICSDDPGLRGAWFKATVLRATNKQNKVLIEYETLVADEEGTKPLREFADAVNLRPIPPRENGRSFELSEEVDAFHKDGWWEGVVTKLVEGKRYAVYFRPSKEELEFGDEDLRLHREWVNGVWVPPFEDGEDRPKVESKEKEKLEEKNLPSALETTKNVDSSKLPVEFNEGMLVEVSSDEEGFVGAWYDAKIVEALGENKYLVEYQTLRTEDETELLREQVDTLHIRPTPPVLPNVDSFRRLEEVDAMYNDGWWVGVISNVIDVKKYIVYFKESNEEIEFGHSDLRLHQDWVDGKWFRLSQMRFQGLKNIGFFPEKALPYTLMKNGVEIFWNTKGNLKITAYGEFFFFKFSEETDRCEALDKNFIQVGGKMVFIRPWDK